MSQPKPIGLLLSIAAVSFLNLSCFAAVNQVEKLAPDVYFHEGDLDGHGHCNNGWVIFEDYVLVIDGNFPSGAQMILPKIKAITNKPIRFAFDTHHHGDHAYGNQLWVDQGRNSNEVKAAVDEIKATLQKQERIARYVGNFFSAQVEKVYVEMGGRPFEPKTAALEEQHHHATAHGNELRSTAVAKTSAPRIIRSNR